MTPELGAAGGAEPDRPPRGGDPSVRGSRAFFPASRRWCLTLIVAASLLSHLKGITAPLLDYHYHRQCNTAAIARNYHAHGLSFLEPRIDWAGAYQGRAATEFPLFMWLAGLLWPLLGLSELWGRLLAAGFSALTAAYLFRFLEEDLGREAAFYAGVLFSCIPLEVYFGRTVQPEALALFATVAAFFHWDRAFRPGRSWGHWLAAVALAFLAVAHKLPYAYLLLPLAHLAWLRLGRPALSDARCLLGLALIPLGVAGWYLYASGGGAYVVPTRPDEFLKMLDYRRLPYFVQFQAFSRFPELATTYGGLVLLAFGARELVFRRGLAFYAVWFLSVWATLIAGGGYTFHHEYTSLPLAPINAAFMGLGLKLLLGRARASHREIRSWALAGVFLLALAVPVHAALRIRHWYHQSYPFLRGAARAADAVSGRDDLFLANERAASVFLFYLDRRGWAWDLAEAGEARLPEVEEKIAQGARFFATQKAGPFKDEDGVYARWFYSRFPVVYDEGGLLIFKLR